jgi:hypothetical protein
MALNEPLLEEIVNLDCINKFDELIKIQEQIEKTRENHKNLIKQMNKYFDCFYIEDENLKMSGWSDGYNMCSNLQFFTQTHSSCLKAVKKDGFALQFVKKQTPEICLTAIKKFGYALEYVISQTPEICMEAIKQVGLGFLKHNKNKVYANGTFPFKDYRKSALMFVENQTKKICIEAVKYHPEAIKLVNEPFKKSCHKYLKYHPIV